MARQPDEAGQPHTDHHRKKREQRAGNPGIGK